MLSKKEKKEIYDKMSLIADEYLKEQIPRATYQDVENLSFVFTYRQTENLVKYSRTLGRLTIILLFFTIILVALTSALVYYTIVLL
jgi:hypothetical protein